MPRLVLRPGAFVIPRRPCSLCGRVGDVLRMTLVARALLCADCVRGDGAASASAGGEAVLGHMESVAARLRRLDGVLRYGGIAARLLGYGCLLWLAHGDELWTWVLSGVLIADVATWAVAAWFDLYAHRLALTLELLAHLLVGRLWLGAGGQFALPEDPVGRAISMLAFGAVFATKISLLLHKILVGGRER